MNVTGFVFRIGATVHGVAVLYYLGRGGLQLYQRARHGVRANIAAATSRALLGGLSFGCWLNFPRELHWISHDVAGALLVAVILVGILHLVSIISDAQQRRDW